MIGATEEAIDKAEDRGKFKRGDGKIGLFSPSRSPTPWKQALTAQAQVGFRRIIRPRFTMGGSGRRHCLQQRRVRHHLRTPALKPDPRAADRAIGAGLERIRDGGRARPRRQLHHHLLDRKPRPDGRAHGDSITVAPAQTLTDKEYQIMRNASDRGAAREIGVDTGGSNVQFAINPTMAR